MEKLYGYFFPCLQRFNTVPVIILTNLNPDDKTLNELMKSGPSYYFVKSKWKLEELAEKVKKELGV